LSNDDAGWSVGVFGSARGGIRADASFATKYIIGALFGGLRRFRTGDIYGF
jgi:hypothetical protein